MVEMLPPIKLDFLDYERQRLATLEKVIAKNNRRNFTVEEIIEKGPRVGGEIYARAVAVKKLRADIILTEEYLRTVDQIRVI